jgi:hypothetical protein
MATSVVLTTELAREYDIDRVGDRVAKRSWVCTLSDDTLTAAPVETVATQILAATSLSVWGQQHPEYPSLGLRKYTLTERFGDSPYHVQIVAEYGLLTANDLLTPTAQAAQWSFEATQGQVPALFYYPDPPDGSGNGTMYPLTNSAFDYFEGLVTEETMTKATMKKNYALFPTSLVANTNSINNAQWFGGPTWTWKITGVNAEYTVAFFNWNVISYWATSVQLMYRQTGWRLQLPDVGWNFIDGGEKRRAMVFDFKNSEWVASANPVALSGGNINVAGRPDILPRRVNPEVDFSSLFPDVPA